MGNRIDGVSAGVTPGPELDADARAGLAESDADRACLASDESRLEKTSSYQEMSSSDQGLARTLVRTLSLAARGDGEGARITRNALDQLLDEKVTFEFGAPTPDNAHADARGFTLDREWASRNGGDPRQVTATVAHEVTHCLNHDFLIEGEPAIAARTEYRSWYVGYVASEGRAPTRNEAHEFVQEGLVANAGGDAGYLHISTAYLDDPLTRGSIERLEQAIDRGDVDPHLGVEDAQPRP